MVNTFTVGDINIELAETTGSTYKIVPGTDIAKDPKVTVKANSEKCWLFVKVDINAAMQTAASKGVEWKYADGWNTLELDVIEDPGYVVLYRIVDADTADQSFYILKGDTAHPNGVVTVPGTLDKTGLAAIKTAGTPTLTFTTYAIQYESFAAPTTSDGGAGNAWNEVSK